MLSSLPAHLVVHLLLLWTLYSVFRRAPSWWRAVCVHLPAASSIHSVRIVYGWICCCTHVLNGLVATWYGEHLGIYTLVCMLSWIGSYFLADLGFMVHIGYLRRDLLLHHALSIGAVALLTSLLAVPSLNKVAQSVIRTGLLLECLSVANVLHPRFKWWWRCSSILGVRFPIICRFVYLFYTMIPYALPMPIGFLLFDAHLLRVLLYQSSRSK